MGFAARKLPSQNDVNEMFSKHNLARTKKIYEKLVNSGKYRFGDLTALFFSLDDEKKKAWENEAASFYPPDIQHEIVRAIEAALFHKNSKGVAHPASIHFSWIAGLSKEASPGIRTTYNSSDSSYLLEIAGFPGPLGGAASAPGAEKE